MKKDEALQRHLDTQSYLHQHKLRALFSELTRELLLRRP